MRTGKIRTERESRERDLESSGAIWEECLSLPHACNTRSEDDREQKDTGIAAKG